MPKVFLASLLVVAALGFALAKETATVSPGERLTDRRDGKPYRTIRIGARTWMAENLAFASDSSRCYDDDPGLCSRFGRMYSQPQARKACPEGWRLPSDAVWKDLVGSVGADGHGFGSRSWFGTGGADFGMRLGGQGNIGGMGSFEQGMLLATFWTSSRRDAQGPSERGSSWFYGGFGEEGDHAIASRDDDTGTWLSVRCVRDDSLAPAWAVKPVDAGQATVRIPAGCFSMGTEQGSVEDYAHPVCLDSFELDRTEVTNEAFARSGMRTHYADTTCSVYDPQSGRFADGIVPESFRGPKKPVVCVDWSEAEAYCRSQGKRLPTEAEHEYANRAGTVTDYFWGDDPDAGCRYANGTDLTTEPGMPGWSDWMQCRDGWAFSTAPVGSLAPNPWGLADLTGNAWEWTADRFGSYDSLHALRRNPRGPAEGDMRTIRGGAWDAPPGSLTVHARGGRRPEVRSFDVGFRCASPKVPARSSLRVGRDVNAPSVLRPGSRIIEAAVRGEDTLALELLSKSVADTQYGHAIRPLHIACDVGTIAAVRTLLRKGVGIDKFNEYGVSPLDLCIDKERLDCVDALLRAGAHPDGIGAIRPDSAVALRFERLPVPPLFRAIRTRNRAIVARLLDAGANLQRPDKDGETPLMAAACQGNPETLSLLLGRGADLGAKDEDGHDAAHYASSCRNEENVVWFRKTLKTKARSAK